MHGSERRRKSKNRAVASTTLPYHPYARLPVSGSRSYNAYGPISNRPRFRRPVKVPMNPPQAGPRARFLHSAGLVTTTGHLISDTTYKVNATHLRSYIRGAFLPDIIRQEDGFGGLPWRGQRSYLNWLHIPYDAERKINTITTIPTEQLKAGIDNFTRNYIYDSVDFPSPIATSNVPPTVSPTEALSVPSILYRPIPKLLEPERVLTLPDTPGSLQELVTWVVEQPLQTVQRALHLAHPGTADWWFDEVQSNGKEEWRNKELCRAYVWKRHPSPKNNCEVKSLAVIIQPPWILTWQDFQDVVECKDLPHHPSPFSSSFQHRVWSLVHDTCKKLNTEYFILTTYEGWVFGRFENASHTHVQTGSNFPIFTMSTPLATHSLTTTVDGENSCSWSRCSISKLMESHARLPNVIETILYWVAASFKLEDYMSGSRSEFTSGQPLSPDELTTEFLLSRYSSFSRSPSPPSPLSSLSSFSSPSPPASPKGNTLEVSSSGQPPCRVKREQRVRSYSPYPSLSSRPKPIRSSTENNVSDMRTENGRKSLFTVIKGILRWFKNRGRMEVDE